MSFSTNFQLLWILYWTMMYALQVGMSESHSPTSLWVNELRIQGTSVMTYLANPTKATHKICE